MITLATDSQTREVREITTLCYPDRDPRYLDYFFKNYYQAENCYLNVIDGEICSMVYRNPHVILFNDRPIKTSMLLGVATSPSKQGKGYMKQLLDVVLDACEHSELITLLQTDSPELYRPFGFENIYKRQKFIFERKDVERTNLMGVGYEPTPIDLLKAYSAFIQRFNGFYPRDLEYYVNYRKQIISLGGKIIGYYDGNNQIRGYLVMLPDGKRLRVEELIYLDSTTIIKLLNAAFQERRVTDVYVSEAEDLTKLFPSVQVEVYNSTMAKLNDASLFNRLYGSKVSNVKEAFSLSKKPLNLNEWE